MNQNEAKLSKEEQKAKIRERYRGHVSSDTVVIPGKPQADLYDDTETKRVAVYARVSTDNVQQTSSYELQKNYYEDQVKRHPNWTLVGIYPDEGISGTSLQHRAKFNQMIADCRAGKIDLIITKSVSRFARNIVDCISLVRELASLNPPVGVFFESENIFTLKDNTEMSLSFVATMAQEESHIKSTIMNASIEMRFGREIYLTPVLLGYDHDEDGNLVINEEEANTVRLIFFILENETRLRYRLNKQAILNPDVVNFMLSVAMKVEDSGYYPFVGLTDFSMLFPFKYHVTKEQIMECPKFSISNFGGELSVSLSDQQ